jgi:hypothetical protein
METPIERKYNKVLDRAQCICEICHQMKWRDCNTYFMDPQCKKLISKFSDHDHSYMCKCYHFRDGRKEWYKKIAGIKTPMSVLNEYTDYINVTLTKLKIHSHNIIEAIYEGKLDGRKKFHNKILKEVGFTKEMMQQPAAQMYLGALDKYAEYVARRVLSWYSDMDIEMEERMKERRKERGRGDDKT